MKKIRILTVLLIIICLCGCSVINAEEKNTTVVETTTPSETEEVTTEEVTTEAYVPVTLDIRMVGDMLLHDAVSNSGKMEDGSYNYDHFFLNVEDEIKKADLAIVNEEVILGGLDLGISGYPCFNGVFEVGDALVKAGFNTILHATNHALDKGAIGIERCLEFWNKTYPETGVVGIYASEEESKNIYIYEKDGIKIAILNYTYGTNGIPLPQGREYMVNILEEDKVVSDLKKADEMADFVIVCPHWGSEYTYTETEEQIYWAQLFADNGADLVIGAHPHVIEPVKWVTGVNGNKMLVYYSLGNFISAQDRWPRMVGAMADITIEKNEAGDVYIKNYGVIPLITHRIFGSGATTTYLLSDYTDELASQSTINNQDPSFSLEAAKDLCRQVFGDLYIEK